MYLSDRQHEIIAAYFRQTAIAAAYLFGSYARGDADEQSDIDLIIEHDIHRRVDARKIRRDLEVLLSMRVEIFQDHRILKYAKARIVQERRVVYRRDPSPVSLHHT